ncbi:precorrin-4 C(11)-methyltransferase [Thermovenabulum sp.]|uniref:precorrin-4 C(11)-methyltransferase n=1 Tax=Thermovenabulum sp. TaxID=3100335 RepID=UPI003C79A756
MVYFVGAGPGDVDLITVRGRKLLEKADVVIYTGSLVSREHLKFCKKKAVLIDSSGLTLEEILEVIKTYEGENKIIVRLHTGDPTIYGAIAEQMEGLQKMGIDYEVVPGVSSFTAAGAVLKKEFTVPGLSQTVILTRLAGKTPVPEREDLAQLSKIGASMAIFLSVKNIEDVVKKLRTGYREDTPVAVVYKATWEDQKIVLGTLKNICDRVREEGFESTAIILVGEFLTGTGKSRLYSKDFSHAFREAKN